MGMWRITGATALLSAAALGASPAAAQFYLQPHDFTGKPVKGDEPGMVVAMPGATPEEYRAALSWTLRSALNVAALQCQFEPTLNSVHAYNSILKDHDAEFDKDQTILQRYYARTPGAGSAKAGKGSKPGQAGFDRFGTQTYSAFSTTAAQFGFCQTASSIAREAVETPRGHFADLAENRMRELRNSLVPAGEERFPYYVARTATTGPVPRLDAQCWNKKGEWQVKKCGAPSWPVAAPGAGTAATAVAANKR